MHYRRFGRTDLQLSVFSLGLMRCLAPQGALRQVVTAAIANGMNHLETAQAYGDSEAQLGRVLKDLSVSDRDRLYLTTKLTPTPNPQSLQEHLEQSLKQLQVETLDCIALHGLNTAQHWDWVQQPGGNLDVLETARQAGKVRHIGFSTHGPLDLIREIIQSDRFDFVNLHYYLFFQHLAPIVEQAQRQDLGVFIISPTDKGGQLHTPSPTLAALCHPFSPQALNYRFLLSDPRITTLSLGAATPLELQAALHVSDCIGPLTPAEARVLQRLGQVMHTQLGPDYCQQCYQCLPCPEAIQIPEVLRLRNLAVAYDMQAFGEYRYQMFENAGHWFPGRKGDRCTECGDCLPRCPCQLNIPRLLQDAHQRFKGPQRRRLWG